MNTTPDKLRIQVLSRDNGAGLTRDITLLRDTLELLGCAVVVTRVGHYHSFQSRLDRGISACRSLRSKVTGRLYQSFDVNLMLERVCPAFFIHARYNVFIPNPEWVRRIWMKYLPRFDLIAAKTHHAVPIFRQLGCTTRWTGWISNDHLDTRVRRERTFLHAAGLSDAKGTHRLLQLWKRHPEWPKLYVLWQTPDAREAAAAQNVELITERLDESRLRHIQNQSCFHVCPSQTEGFGHYIAEALGIGAVCITTNAAPMNELVAPVRGVLVDARPGGSQNLATLYDFDESAMCAAIERCVAMPDQECAAIGASARQWFEADRSEFPSRISGMLRELAVPQATAVRAAPGRRPDQRLAHSSTGAKGKG